MHHLKPQPSGTVVRRQGKSLLRYLGYELRLPRELKRRENILQTQRIAYMPRVTEVY